MAALTRRAQLAVAITCLTAATCCAGAVTERALFGCVMPAVVLGSASAAVFVTHRQLRAAVITGLVVTLVWAELANLITGVSNGPAARSSAAAGAGATLAIAAADSRWPALFLAPVGGIVLAAIMLGAGGEVRVVAMVTAAAAVVALAVVESSYRRWTRLSATQSLTRRWSIGVVAILVMATAALAAVTQAHHDSRPPRASIAGTTNSLVRPPWSDPLPKTSTSNPVRLVRVRQHSRLHEVTQLPLPHADLHVLRRQLHRRTHRMHSESQELPRQRRLHRYKKVAHHHLNWFVIVLFAIVGLLLLFTLAVLVRMVVVQRAWRQLRRDLRTGPADSTTGAWVWARLRLAASQIPLPPRLSPDLVERGPVIHEVPPHTAKPLRALSRLATPAAFSVRPGTTESDAQLAWQWSDQACEAAESALSRAGRFRLRLVSPPMADTRR